MPIINAIAFICQDVLLKFKRISVYNDIAAEWTFVVSGSIVRICVCGVYGLDAKAKVLAELIDRRGSRRAFAESIGLPPTTLQSMLTRGVGRASIDNVMKVCRALGITVEQLEAMARGLEENREISAIAAHHDGEDWTEEELEEIERFKEFVRMRRQLKQRENQEKQE